MNYTLYEYSAYQENVIIFAVQGKKKGEIIRKLFHFTDCLISYGKYCFLFNGDRGNIFGKKDE